jgi:hypothetical protein
MGSKEFGGSEFDGQQQLEDGHVYRLGGKLFKFSDGLDGPFMNLVDGSGKYVLIEGEINAYSRDDSDYGGGEWFSYRWRAANGRGHPYHVLDSRTSIRNEDFEHFANSCEALAAGDTQDASLIAQLGHVYQMGGRYFVFVEDPFCELGEAMSAIGPDGEFADDVGEEIQRYEYDTCNGVLYAVTFGGTYERTNVCFADFVHVASSREDFLANGPVSSVDANAAADANLIEMLEWLDISTLPKPPAQPKPTTRKPTNYRFDGPPDGLSPDERGAF